MTKKSYEKAQVLYNVISTAQGDIKSIKRYEQKYKGYVITVSVPFAVGSWPVDSHINIGDEQCIKDILNVLKIHLVQKIQHAEKELEGL